MNTIHSTQPAGAPAYLLGRPATAWQIALRRQRRRSDDPSPISATTRDRRVAIQHGAMPSLVEADSAADAHAVHREAHGLVADAIYEVEQG